MALGITIKQKIGVGDALQFSSVPENYFRATGTRIVDVSKPWFFDHNPFVLRDPPEAPKRVIEMWNFSPTQYQWPKIRPEGIYLSNAELHAAVVGVLNPKLNRPRLYRYEDFPFQERKKILVHPQGKSHGEMPEHIMLHILKKYAGTGRLYQVGMPGDRDWGIPKIETASLWELAKVISEASMFIGVDSGPGWIACCYPDVVVKIVRTRPSVDQFKKWIPLETQNIHSHWDDRCRQVFNPSDDDVGFTYSYRRI